MKLRLLKFRSPHGPPPLTRILLVTLVALVFLAVTVRLLYSSHSRHQASRQRQRAHDIFFETEGTTTPWRDWANATHGAAPPTGEAAFLARLRERHGLTRDLPFLGRRIKVEYRKSPGVGSRILGVATGGIKHGGRGGGGGGLDDRPSMTILQDGGAAASLVHGTNWGWRTVRVPEGSIFDSDDRAFLDLRTDPALLRLPMSRSGRDQRRPDTVDASGLVIGVVTTLARLVHADSAVVRDWTRWLTDGKGKSNGAVLALVLKGLDETAYGRRQDLQNVRKRLASVGIDAIVVPVAPTGNVRGRGGDKGKRDDVGSGAGESTTRKGGRVEGDEPEVKVGSYFELIPLLRETANRLEREGKPKRTWLGLVDDEVFLPSMGRLLHKLGAFNPNKEHYVGLPSEKADWVREGDVTTTYGGAAIFLTPSMADTIAKLDCNSNTTTPPTGVDPDTPEQWDVLLYHCIRSRTHHNLHVLPSFYSPSDSSLHVYGPAAGYESGLSTPPLSLHHARARHRPLDPSRAHLVASLCGEPCFLQRFLLRDNWVIVNGYAIVEYPDGVVAVDTREAARLATKPQPPSSSRGGAADADDQPPSRAQTDLEVDPRIDVDDSDRHPRDRVVLAWSGKRRVWRLVDARLDESTGEVWQAYVRRRRGNDIGGAPWTDDELSVPPEDHVHAVDDPPGDVDSVILLVWEPSS